MNKIMRKLPIGIQTFEDIRRDNYRYVDKTAFVWQLANLDQSFIIPGTPDAAFVSDGCCKRMGMALHTYYK